MIRFDVDIISYKVLENITNMFTFKYNLKYDTIATGYIEF